MTIDDAIRHCLEVVKRCELHMYEFPDQLAYVERFYNPKKRAEYHRQLVEWLKDYKRLLAVEEGIDIRCGNCKHDGTGDGECEKCYMYKRWELEDEE